MLVTNEIMLEASEKYDTTEEDFFTAYVAENYDTGAGISDPRYVRWVAHYL